MADRQLWNNQLRKSQTCTIDDFRRVFPDDDACLDYIMEQRHPGRVAVCEKCKVERKHYRIAGRKVYSCDHCGTQISPLAGTIFEKSSTDLHKWFHAMYQMGSTKCGISAKQIQRETGVTYKTAWRMFKQIRTLMSEEISLEGSTVEMDETYVGGHKKGQRGRPTVQNSKKVPVVGIAERKTDEKKGRVVARVASNANSKTLHGMIKEYVLPKTVIYTDEWNGYNGIEKLTDNDGQNRGYQHRRINHSAGVYVQGDVHTQAIEGFWSLVKRGIGGAHHAVSAKFLQSYLDEYSFRYNRRDVARPMVMQILERVCERAE
jgi:transposase-like protein